MIKTEILTGEELKQKWPEMVKWISECHMLDFQIDFDFQPVYEGPSEEVVEYCDSGIRTLTIRIREFSETEKKIRSDTRPFDPS